MLFERWTNAFALIELSLGARQCLLELIKRFVCAWYMLLGAHQTPSGRETNAFESSSNAFARQTVADAHQALFELPKALVWRPKAFDELPKAFA